MLDLHCPSAAGLCTMAWPAPRAWLVANSCSTAAVVPSRVLLAPQTVALLLLNSFLRQIMLSMHDWRSSPGGTDQCGIVTR